MAERELHLFIIWNKAYVARNRILKDLSLRFSILRAFEIHWSSKSFIDNLIRFYGDSYLILWYKRLHCGSGPFTVIVVEDLNPKYENRETTKGTQEVNTNTFDAKNLYRTWSGGGHRVHATNSTEEFRYDYSILTGESLSVLENKSQWDGKITKLHTDLAGTHGWFDLNQLFQILNQTSKYVVLRNFEVLPDEYRLSIHGDIDLLTDDIYLLKRITNAKKVLSYPNRVLHLIKIGKEDIPFDFRYVHDGYYDSKWETDILNSRVLHYKNFYIPDNNNLFYSLLYHATIHKREFSQDYKTLLLSMAKDFSINGVDKSLFENTKKIRDFLNHNMSVHDYKYTDPHDLSVFFNSLYTGHSSKKFLRRYGVPIYRALRRQS